MPRISQISDNQPPTLEHLAHNLVNIVVNTECFKERENPMATQRSNLLLPPLSRQNLIGIANAKIAVKL